MKMKIIESNNQIKAGYCMMQGWKRTMEDNIIFDINFADDISLFAIFDGHEG